MEDPEAKTRRHFLFRKRFHIYAILLLCFIGWRVYRYQSWLKKRPDIFTLYEEYKRNNRRPDPTPAQLAAMECRRILVLRDADEKMRNIDRFFAAYGDSSEPPILVFLARLANVKAELLQDRQEKIRLLDWVLAQRQPVGLPDELQVEILTAAHEKALSLESGGERLGVLNDALAFFPGQQSPWVAMHIASLKRDKAKLLTDDVQKIAIYEEVAADMEGIPHPYAEELAAFSLNCKSRLVDPVQALPILDGLIDTYGNRRHPGIERQVAWALEKKAALLDGPERMKVLDRIILDYRDRDQRFFQSVVSSSIEKKLALLAHDPNRDAIIEKTMEMLVDTRAARHIPKLRQALRDG